MHPSSVSRFQVRGVSNLRVVDASAFPDIPGEFGALLCPTWYLTVITDATNLNRHVRRHAHLSNLRKGSGRYACFCQVQPLDSEYLILTITRQVMTETNCMKQY
jgi:hypothetical protein